LLDPGGRQDLFSLGVDAVFRFDVPRCAFFLFSAVIGSSRSLPFFSFAILVSSLFGSSFRLSYSFEAAAIREGAGRRLMGEACGIPFRTFQPTSGKGQVFSLITETFFFVKASHR